MPVRTHLKPADLQGIAQLAVDATLGVTGIVESMYRTIGSATSITGDAPQRPTRGIPGLVYRSVRGITRLTGSGIQAAMRPLIPLFGKQASSIERDAVLAAMNGVMGDYLVATANPLAIPMHLRRNGTALELRKDALAIAIPAATEKVLITIHGLCMSDHCWQWKGHDHGTVLSSQHGLARLDVNYNSGLHISTNGQSLADLLEKLASAWPVPLREIHLLCHSMGGLVARSALHAGAFSGHAWPERVAKVFFLGTPHLGAPLERGGHGVDTLLSLSPYVAPFARLGQVRSAGITDLRHANLVDGDWQGIDRFARTTRRPTPLPLPPGLAFHAIAAVTGERAGDVKSRLLGDGLVPVASALGRHRVKKWSLDIAESQRWIVTGTNHMDLLGSAAVCEQISRWIDQ
ncbi:MAG: alpha/beta hydrolase [Betaproteobacteria bacterium]|nr:alpha/beta hydrolase [Betaproteobacteria bacterium]